MQHFPTPPSILITRQIECIRCRHKFSVSEAKPDAVKPDDTELEELLSSDNFRRSNNYWQPLRNHHPDTHRHVNYGTDDAPYTGPYHDYYFPQLEPGHDAHMQSGEINDSFCSRCGADNRNWLYLKSNPTYKIESQARKYLFWGYLLVIGLLGVMVLANSASLRANGPIRTVLILLILILAGLLPLIIIPSQWKALREYRYLRQVIPANSPFDRISPTVQTAVTLGAIFLLVLPISILFLLPITRDVSQTLFVSNNEAEIVKQIDKLTTKLPTYLKAHPEEQRVIINALIGVQQQLDMPSQSPDPNQAIEQTIVWAGTVLDEASKQINNLDPTAMANLNMHLTRLDNIMAAVEEVQITATVSFFSIWLKYVGLISLLGSILALIAVGKIEKEYDAHLPRPIYHNLSEMTRVARWEANKALRAKESTEWVQWTKAERMSSGGLVLQGFLRGMPKNGEKEVRAQKFTIETDKWCRISLVDIEDTTTLIPPSEVSGGHIRSITGDNRGRDENNNGGYGGGGGGGNGARYAIAAPKQEISRQLEKKNNFYVTISSR